MRLRSVVGLALVLGVPAFAAKAGELVTKGPAEPAAHWGGLYVGGWSGLAWGGEKASFPNDAVNSIVNLPISQPLDVSSGSRNAKSGASGGTLGYNYQAGAWILGAEAEAGVANLNAANTSTSFPISQRSHTDFIGTLGARFGHSWDNLLVFGKVGGSWSHNVYSDAGVADITSAAPGSPPETIPAGVQLAKTASNRFGLMLGAGFEYALSPRWSLKAQYEYLDFGRERITFLPTAATMQPFDQDIRRNASIFQIGLNYNLGPDGGPETGARVFKALSSGAQQSHFYGGVDYLLWSVKGAPLSLPLVSSASSSLKEGFLVSNEVEILYGSSMYPATGGNGVQNFPIFNGGRVTLGYTFDDSRFSAVEASGFALQSRAAGYFNTTNLSTGKPAMRVPVYGNVAYAPGGACDPGASSVCSVGPGEDGVPISLPADNPSVSGDLYGSVRVRNTLQLWGMDAAALAPLYTYRGWDLTGMVGATYLSLQESFNLTANLNGYSTSPLYAGQSGTANDWFSTSNQFYGALLGLRANNKFGPISVQATGKLGLGDSHEVLRVSGYYSDSGAAFASSGGPYGIFAMPANEGAFTRNEFAVLTQAQVKLGYELTPWLQLTLGYDVLYESNVIRPTDQISRAIPKGQTFQQDGTAASTTSPARLLRSTDFYAQGLTAGLQASF